MPKHWISKYLARLFKTRKKVASKQATFEQVEPRTLFDSQFTIVVNPVVCVMSDLVVGTLPETLAPGSFSPPLQAMHGNAVDPATCNVNLRAPDREIFDELGREDYGIGLAELLHSEVMESLTTSQKDQLINELFSDSSIEEPIAIELWETAGGRIDRIAVDAVQNDFARCDVLPGWFVASVGIPIALAASTTDQQLSTPRAVDRKRTFGRRGKYVFVSYVGDDEETVRQLCHHLELMGISVWFDKRDIRLCGFWKEEIRDAIKSCKHFLVCFSSAYWHREETYMREELLLAIEKLRLRGPGTAWFIPVRLDECDIPNLKIGGGLTINDIQYVDLFKNWNDAICDIADVIENNREISDKRDDSTQE